MFKESGAFGLLLTTLILFLNGCEISSEVSSTEQKVLSFRQQIMVKNYEAVFESASPEFKRSMNKGTWYLFVKKMDQFGSEIGVSENFELVRHGISTDTINGTLLVLVYKGRTNGRVLSEEYIFKLENGNYLLFNYKFDETS